HVSLTDEPVEEDGDESDVHLGVMDNRFGSKVSIPPEVATPSSSQDDKQKEMEKEKEKEKAKDEAKKEKDEATSPSEDKASADEQVIIPADLPLGAKVDVLESGRTVNTDPSDGTYSMMHPTGDYTVEASAYGFESESVSVTIQDEETTTANFTLNEIAQGEITGTVVDEDSGEGIAGAKVLLVEDANVEPVETDEDGNFSMTA